MHINAAGVCGRDFGEMRQQEAALPSTLGTAKPLTQLQSSPIPAPGWVLPPGGAICYGVPTTIPVPSSHRHPFLTCPGHRNQCFCSSRGLTELLRAALRLGWTKTADCPEPQPVPSRSPG